MKSLDILIQKGCKQSKYSTDFSQAKGLAAATWMIPIRSYGAQNSKIQVLYTYI